MRRILALSLFAVFVTLTTVAGDSTPTTVVQLGAAEVSAAFAKGRPLYETDAYKIHASRREGPGQAEVHVRDTDVIYVLEGGATLVTGGTVSAPKTIGPDEIRGTSIENGAPRTLAKGDIVVVPNGVPHWFRDVQAPLLYYVVKVTAPAGGTR
jgi:glc operon protein GlcG